MTMRLPCLRTRRSMPLEPPLCQYHQSGTAANPNVRLSDVDLLSSAETVALLEERHMTQITEATFAAVFEKQASKHLTILR
nr:hypothetical protein P5630_03110 [Bacillus subtilis]